MKDTIEIMKTDGNYDEYQFGFTNGLILALSIMEDVGILCFVEKPNVYIADTKKVMGINTFGVPIEEKK